MSWGVDLEHFRPAESDRAAVRSALGLPEGRIILSPRSLMPLYNPRVIVEAFELLADELPDLQLVLKHMGTDQPAIGPLRHPDRVHVVGHVPYERMVEWYQAADVCVSVASSDSSPQRVGGDGERHAVRRVGPPVGPRADRARARRARGADRSRPVAAAIRGVLDDPDLAGAMARRARAAGRPSTTASRRRWTGWPRAIEHWPGSRRRSLA